MSIRFAEVGDRIWVLRHPVLDVNVTLVLGDGAALLVDTLSTAEQATDLAAAVRAITAQPWTIVNTHHHFDHCFGNATLAGDPARPVYAHETTLALLRDHPDEVRRQAYEEMLASEPELATALRRTPVLAPSHAVHREATLDLGGRPVMLRHLGRGHTAGDLVVHVPDADVLIAGDLVEESGPPAFADSYPLDWAGTLAELLRHTTAGTRVVPGHGAVVDRDFVRAQHDQLTALGWLIREGHCDHVPAERVAAQAPFGPEPALMAVRRGYVELTDGT